MTLSEASFSTALPVDVLVRQTGERDADWQEFDHGPGYFHIPPDHEVRVRIKNIGNAELVQLVADLQDHSFITDLDLSENRNITDAGVAKLIPLKHLKRLSLSACDISDKAVDNLLVFDRLERLNLSYCNRITDRGVKQLDKLRNLEYLDLQGCIKVTHAGAARIERNGLTIYKPSKGQKMRAANRR